MSVADPGRLGSVRPDRSSGSSRFVRGSVQLTRSGPKDPGAAVEGRFFDRVYDAVEQIPEGCVSTYGGISEMLIGRKTAARTVGWALHGLPPERVEEVPWWRVVNAHGRISTTCEEHSADLQRATLEAEGVRFGADGRIDLDRFGWWGPDAE